MSDIDALVVGAGVIGLAIARALALSGRSVVVMDAAGGIGSETSSRNSEVKHAGIYYPTGSLKAQLCVAGRNALYEFCEGRGVAHARCGKLIVAAERRRSCRDRSAGPKGAANGVERTWWLAPRLTRWSPTSTASGRCWRRRPASVDSHAFMLALQGDAAEFGAAFAFRTPFLRAEVGPMGSWSRRAARSRCASALRILVNAAGLHGRRSGRAIDGLDPWPRPETRYAKGNYFALRGRAPFRRLIYPAPHPHGLGVHLTFDLAGQARFGPDVEWIDTDRLQRRPAPRRGFAEAIRRYWPGLPDDALTPAYAGVRPRSAAPTSLPPIFASTVPNAMAFPASSICSGSKARA